MKRILILLVVLAGVTQAAETKCCESQSSCLCSVAPGGWVYIQVMSNASGHQVRCKKQLPSGLVDVFTVKKEKVTIHEAFRNRTRFFINNGTFAITDVEMNDSGHYIIEAFDPNGLLVRNMNVQLDVQKHAFSILIPVSAGVAALLLPILLVLVCYCVCKRNRKSGSSK